LVWFGERGARCGKTPRQTLPSRKIKMWQNIRDCKKMWQWREIFSAKFLFKPRVINQSRK